MNEKKIEPTAAMVRDVECWRSFTGTADRTPLRPILRAALNHYDAPGLFADEDALRAAREEGWDQATRWIDSYQGGPNGRTSSARSANPYRPVQELPPERDGVALVPADARPWEPLNGGPVRVGDEVRQERAGITTTAVVGRVDDGGDPWTDWGDPWTDGGALIGLLRHGTWYVRRPVQELPRKEGTLIVPADGREFIEAEVWGKTYYASEAILLGERDWLGAWRSPHSVQVDVTSGQITPGTWKVGNR